MIKHITCHIKKTVKLGTLLYYKSHQKDDWSNREIITTPCIHYDGSSLMNRYFNNGLYLTWQEALNNIENKNLPLLFNHTT